jgi:hypothetical protein
MSRVCPSPTPVSARVYSTASDRQSFRPPRRSEPDRTTTGKPKTVPIEPALIADCHGRRSSWQVWCNQKARKQRLLDRKLSPLAREPELLMGGNPELPRPKVNREALATY